MCTYSRVRRFFHIFEHRFNKISFRWALIPKCWDSPGSNDWKIFFLNMVVWQIRRQVLGNWTQIYDQFSKILYIAQLERTSEKSCFFYIFRISQLFYFILKNLTLPQLIPNFKLVLFEKYTTQFWNHLREAAKKSSFLSGPTTKTGKDLSRNFFLSKSVSGYFKTKKIK